MPDREERFAAMLDAVDATAPTSRPLRVLDLCGGTGSISLRLVRRRPDAAVTLVDLDPALLRIARGSLPDTVAVVQADLREAGWPSRIGRDFDAILTATALHWFAADELSTLYGQILDLLAPGGIFVNADHMPDDDLPALTEDLYAADKRRREALYATGAAVSWEGWWNLVAADPVLGPLKTERDELFSIHHGQEWTPPVGWHRDALLAAGFAEAGLVWRGGLDAAVAARRAR